MKVQRESVEPVVTVPAPARKRIQAAEVKAKKGYQNAICFIASVSWTLDRSRTWYMDWTYH